MKYSTKYVFLSIVISYMKISTVATTTNNRILLSSLMVGAALGASLSGSYTFSEGELALLTTGVLVLNFPGNKQAEDSIDPCIAKGYARSPILGCYRLIKDAKLIQPEAKQRCAQDGGRLLLVNSAEESQEVLSLLVREGVEYVWIQGSRSSLSAPWLADDGTPLPYTGTIDNNNVPDSFKMAFYQRLYAYPALGQYYPLCEI
ncbi:uncharacterized protein LOC128164203 [Crassostrea angulata]|uniref:uncharacterized protein LOC128164203 n=1 Tax=Magallana angulata TaxID=2784310 RepID=UPI0022B10212|nr:uncharacterized protein LOC128164203 [Crassostrea angulata]